MPNDTTAALQALMQQVQALTDKVAEQDKTLEMTKKRNDRLLDKTMDDKRTQNALMDAVDRRFEEQRMRDAGFTKDATGRYRSGDNNEGSMIITRQQARDPVEYRRLKAEAEAAGVTLEVLADEPDPTQTGYKQTSEIIQSKTVTFDDDHDRIRYVREDMNTGSGLVQRRMAAERAGLKTVTFRTLDDLPDHARTKFLMMEKAVNDVA